ncbi:ABC transporter permease [Actinomyces minihominis]|uniref:ABC transporter permease n=1 Tax=Actinomyces minihominis TaxID=2002838 RepID=UPI000C08707F|nr:ABC transporter permease [Actinomyces minihominis]
MARIRFHRLRKGEDEVTEEVVAPEEVIVIDEVEVLVDETEPERSRADWARWFGRSKKKDKKPKLRSGFTFRDLVHESLEGVGSRPSRLLITLLGTILGIASLVATLGLAQTTAGQISKNFDLLQATRVTVQPGKVEGQGGQERISAAIPWNAVSRVQDLVGVVTSTLYSEVTSGPTVTAVQIVDPSEAASAPPTVVAASPELLEVVQGKLGTGRFFDTGHDQRQDRVVVLGRQAAEKLGINRVSGQPAIFINGMAYSVIGILDEVGVRENLLRSVIVPVETARADLGLTVVDSLDIRVDMGAAQVVARQAPIALDPNNPEAYKVKAPPSTSALQGQVQADINVLFVAIGLVALVGGGIGIANVTLLSVTERRGEIGLRRALGAKTSQIAQQFILESLTTGILGGLIGVALGLFTILGVSVLQGWTPVLAPWVPVAGVVVGALVGLIAGTYPAIKAARTEPVDALRGA